MKRSLRGFRASLNQFFLKTDAKSFRLISRRIRRVIRGADVLQTAAGDCRLAKAVACACVDMAAVDASPAAIARAGRGRVPENLLLEDANAACLPYVDNAFDAAILMNAPLLLYEPEEALEEIARVLAPGGVLIAPCLAAKKPGLTARLWSALLNCRSRQPRVLFTAPEYLAFLQACGWRVVHCKRLPARLPGLWMLYVECTAGH